MIVSRIQQQRELLSSFLKGLAVNKLALVSTAILCSFTLTALLAPLLIDPRSIEISPEKRYLPPSLEHPLGTDHMGRDILRQLLLGTSDVFRMGLFVASIAITIGTLVGLYAGYAGGSVDRVLMTLTDTVILIPSFPLILILIATFKRMDVFSIGAISALTMWMGYARGMRARILQVREMPFVEALKGLGVGDARIILGEILPLVSPYMIVEFVRMFRGGIFVIVGLAFLGVTPWSPYNWGTMLNIAYFQARSIFISGGFWHWFSPLTAIVMLQWSLTEFSRYIKEVLIPRLKEYE
ncbi:MAG: ABC transporter permease [Thermofilum sp.]